MKILVLTSGGDAPGMNRLVYKLSKVANSFYSYGGFKGLCENKIFPLKGKISKQGSFRGGSLIKSMRYPEFTQEKTFIKGLKKAKEFDYVIVIGGNGSEKGAKALAQKGVNVIFVPATIDNDVTDSCYSIGFDSAVNQCLYVINNTMPSFHATNKACVYVVMGNASCEIAQEVDKICHSDYLITEKQDLNYTKIAQTIKHNIKLDKGTCIILKEKIVNLEEFKKKIAEKLKDDQLVRVQIIGYLQRGCNITLKEKKMADGFAKGIVNLIKSKSKSKRILIDKKGKFFVTDF